jgi:hypothetical protein
MQGEALLIDIIFILFKLIMAVQSFSLEGLINWAIEQACSFIVRRTQQFDIWKKIPIEFQLQWS